MNIIMKGIFWMDINMVLDVIMNQMVVIIIVNGSLIKKCGKLFIIMQ